MWKHVFRETNQPADILAKYGFNFVTDGSVFSFCPNFLKNAVMAENISFLGN